MNGHSVNAGVSAGIGYAFRAAGSVENLPGGNSASLYSAVNVSHICGQASRDLGVYF